MSSQERAKAMAALSAQPRTARAATATARARAGGTAVAALAAPSEPVLLLLERRADKGLTQRQGDAYYYDYQADETLHQILDLDTGTVVSSENLVGVQLPLIGSEVSRAFELVLSNRRYRRSLDAAYLATTGEALSTQSSIAAQLSYKAFVFHPDTIASGLPQSARRCGVQRCAQLLMYTQDNTALNFSPLVNLSTGQVLANLEALQ